MSSSIAPTGSMWCTMMPVSSWSSASSWMWCPTSGHSTIGLAFFLTTLEQSPSLHIEPNEVKDCAWRSPLDYLQACLRKELWLPPPQFYELSRFLNFRSLEELRQFAMQRAANGIVLTHPVMYKCNDGVVHLLPGDDAYPANPDASSDQIETGLCVEDFRAQVKSNLHRSEHRSQHQAKLIINFAPTDGQVNPLDPAKM
ncbi:nucleoside diphosphate-linked moiety X motif 19 [Drosophila obscura]|uniref:nucleoside diphosphate-linked moiety X motif 19 n=1 Tax=Drosophila obscura TaxID=7282 RepID=UPI001BB1147F|nr:nucleoside diphosphate-linked moiety X motif 19 [Drosophila obscura]